MCLVIPSKVKKIQKGSALVEGPNGFEAAKTSLVKVAVGDWVLTQAGFIVQKLSKQEALKTLEYYEQK